MKISLPKLNEFRNFNYVQGASLGLTIAMLMIVAVIVFIFAKNLIVMELLPELDKKSQVIGKTILNPVERALKLGLNIKTLRGVDDHFNAARNDNPEIIALHLLDVNEKPLYQSIDEEFDKKIKEGEEESYLAKVPFKNGDIIVGHLNIGININLIRKVYRDSVYDLFIIIFVSLIIAFEVLVFVFRYRVTEPISNLIKLMHQIRHGEYRDDLRLSTMDEIGLFSHSFAKLIKKTSNFFYRVKSRIEIYSIINEEKAEKITHLMDSLQKKYSFQIPLKHMNLTNIFYVRLPLFLFVFAESLSNSFIPLYSRQLFSSHSGMSPSLATALPLVFFMISYAFSQPLSGYWAQITSKRYVFLSGGILYCIGILGAAFATTLVDFTFWRFISGFGFGFFLIACQAFVMEFMEPGKKVQTMAMFMGGYYAASVCGTPIGALLAEGIGYRPTLIVAFFAALASVVYTQVYLKPKKDSEGSTDPHKVSLRSFSEILKNPEFVRFLALIAIPSRILMAGCILYGMPVYLKTMNYSTSLIGRIIMIYALMIYALGYFIAKYIDRQNNALFMILAGSLITTLSSIIFFISSEFVAILSFMVLFGLGHSLSLTAQITIPPMLSTGNSTTTLSIYRFFEIMGFAMGPFIMGIIMNFMSPQYAMMTISIPSALFVVLYFVSSFRRTNLAIQSQF